MAVLENRADRDGEGLPAAVALVQAGTGRLALKAANLGRVAVVLTVRANRGVRPKLRLDVSKRCYLVVKPSVSENGLGHGRELLWPNRIKIHWVCQVKHRLPFFAGCRCCRARPCFLTRACPVSPDVRIGLPSR